MTTTLNSNAMKWPLLSLVLFCLSACCAIYPRISLQQEHPTFSIGNNYPTTICSKEEITVTFWNRSPYTDSSYMEEYLLPNGSEEFDYVARITYGNRRKKRDTSHYVMVGKGSEFFVEKCKFRVLHVEPRTLYDSVTQKTDGEWLTLELLNCPTIFCDCRELKKKNCH